MQTEAIVHQWHLPVRGWAGQHLHQWGHTVHFPHMVPWKELAPSGSVLFPRFSYDGQLSPHQFLQSQILQKGGPVTLALADLL